MLDERVQIGGALPALHGTRIFKESGQALALLLQFCDLQFESILLGAEHFIASPNREGANGEDQQGQNGNRADHAGAQREAPVALERRC